MIQKNVHTKPTIATVPNFYPHAAKTMHPHIECATSLTNMLHYFPYYCQHKSIVLKINSENKHTLLLKKPRYQTASLMIGQSQSILIGLACHLNIAPHSTVQNYIRSAFTTLLLASSLTILNELGFCSFFKVNKTQVQPIKANQVVNRVKFITSCV